MNEGLGSILTGTAVLSMGAFASLVLTILLNRKLRAGSRRVFLLGLAVLSLHFLEEFWVCCSGYGCSSSPGRVLAEEFPAARYARHGSQLPATAGVS